MTDQLRVFSYGGGVQSTAALVLAAQGKIDFRVFLSLAMWGRTLSTQQRLPMCAIAQCPMPAGMASI